MVVSSFCTPPRRLRARTGGSGRQPFLCGLGTESGLTRRAFLKRRERRGRRGKNGPEQARVTSRRGAGSYREGGAHRPCCARHAHFDPPYKDFWSAASPRLLFSFQVRQESPDTQGKVFMHRRFTVPDRCSDSRLCWDEESGDLVSALQIAIDATALRLRVVDTCSQGRPSCRRPTLGFETESRWDRTADPQKGMLPSNHGGLHRARRVPRRVPAR